jgi:hypothetical protein
MRELSARAPALIADALLQSDQPLLLRGLVADWPAVRAARSPEGIGPYLRAHDGGATVGAWLGAPEIDGRFHYSDDYRGFNFSRALMRFGAVLDALERHAADTRPPAIYVGSTTIDTTLPRFNADNALAPTLRDALQPMQPLVSLWMGNRARVAAHQDLPDNLACVVAGRRRFTLLPPDQVANLYVGPLEHTLAGQPTSIVDFARPDFARFPRFAEALRHAQVVELEPGDAVFIPSLWWHHVEAMAPLNLLVNHWWRRTPPHLDSPVGALLHTMMTVRDLPPAQRQAWRHLFDHYVFDADDTTAAHLPPDARQVLAPLDDAAVRGLRARLLRRLNR